MLTRKPGHETLNHRDGEITDRLTIGCDGRTDGRLILGRRRQFDQDPDYQ